MSTELDVPMTTNLVLLPRLTAVELKVKNQKNSESQSRPTYGRDEIPTATERSTSNTKSSEDHFLEIRSLLQGMQDKFHKEIETLKVDITLQRSLLKHNQANQLLPHRPPSPKLSYHPQHVPQPPFHQ